RRTPFLPLCARTWQPGASVTARRRHQKEATGTCQAPTRSSSVPRAYTGVVHRPSISPKWWKTCGPLASKWPDSRAASGSATDSLKHEGEQVDQGLVVRDPSGDLVLQGEGELPE